jgi:hypothetical protein
LISSVVGMQYVFGINILGKPSHLCPASAWI